METFESTEELEDVSRTGIAGRMPHIAGEQIVKISCTVNTSNISASGVFAKGAPSLAVVAHLSGMLTEKPKNPIINPLTNLNP